MHEQGQPICHGLPDSTPVQANGKKARLWHVKNLIMGCYVPKLRYDYEKRRCGGLWIDFHHLGFLHFGPIKMWPPQLGFYQTLSGLEAQCQSCCVITAACDTSVRLLTSMSVPSAISREQRRAERVKIVHVFHTPASSGVAH